MHFAIYELHCTIQERFISHCYIVLKNTYGISIYFTKLEKYARTYNEIKVPWTAKATLLDKRNLQYVCKALNYILIQHHKQYKVCSVHNITEEMIFDFLKDYAHSEKNNGGYRSQQSIDTCTKAVLHFFANIALDCNVNNISQTNLLKKQEQRVSKKFNRTKSIFVPIFYEKANSKPARKLLRDIPLAALDILIELSQIHTPEIAFAIIIQLSAGLRSGEVLNLHQNTKQKRSNILISYKGTTVTQIQLDLREELALRSDGKRVGGIKKKRMQDVYPSYIELFMQGKRFHDEYLKNKTYEKDYAPLFLGQNGCAMTYQTYLRTFHRLIHKHLYPAMLNSEDANLVSFGQALSTQTLSPHALRHSYTVNLVLAEVNIATLQSYRGDTSPESALWYLQNKGAIIQKVSDAHDKATDAMIKFQKTGENHT